MFESVVFKQGGRKKQEKDNFLEELIVVNYNLAIFQTYRARNNQDLFTAGEILGRTLRILLREILSNGLENSKIQRIKDITILFDIAFKQNSQCYDEDLYCCSAVLNKLADGDESLPLVFTSKSEIHKIEEMLYKLIKRIFPSSNLYSPEMALDLEWRTA